MTWPHIDRGLAATVGITAVAYLLALPMFLERLDPLTGDEPFYVMTAISIVRDFDLDESNNYAGRAYEEFYPPDPLPPTWRGWPGFPRELPPHPAISEQPGLHTKHGIGLSILIAVPYEVSGRVGSDFLVIACAVALAGQMYLLGRDAGGSAGLAASIALALALSMPIAPYALLLFPEVPAALLLLYAVRRLAAESNAAWQMTLAGTCVGFLPWLHQRFGPSAAVLGIVMVVVWKHVQPRKLFVVALLPVAAGGLSLIAYNQWLYGQPLQNSRDHAGFSRLDGTINGLFGLLVDAQWGLFIAAPLLILTLGAIPWWWESSRRLVLIATGAVVPYVLLVAAYKVWWGEWGPPARYLVPIVPFAAGPLVAWLARTPIWWRALPATLWVLGMAFTLIGVRNPQRFYHHPDGMNNLARRLGELLHVDIAGRLVAFQPYAKAPSHEREAAAYLTLAAIVLAYLVVRVIPLLIAQSKRNSVVTGQVPSEER